VEEPLDVTLEDVSNLLRRAADRQQAGTYSASAAPGEPLYVLQYAAVFQRLRPTNDTAQKLSFTAQS